MDQRIYTDLSIVTAKYFLKFAGVWFTMDEAEERQRWVALLWVFYTGLYCVYVNVLNIRRYWGDDMSYCVFGMSNILIIIMAISKVVVLRLRRFELADVVIYAERHFWHYNYNPEEQLIFSKCQRFCKLWIIFVFCIPPASMSGYVISPIINNIGKNKSDREFPLKISPDWPATETPYFELIFTFQVLCVLTLGIAYICPDTFLCILNMHVISQFRMLQCKIMNCWVSENKQEDTFEYVDQCSAAMKECVRQHQSLILFCEKLENVFTMAIFWHMVIFSLLVGLNCYQILLADAPISRRSIFMFHVIGSFIHLVIFAYCCNGLTEESMNIATTIYFGPWNTLPMNKIGRMLRLNMRMIMLRSMKPCFLTAGGFFPVSLETATSLLSSTVSYFTLMRERFLRNDSQ